MSQNQALDTLHGAHHPDSLKYKVGAAVTSHLFELVIILCIFADIALVFTEMGVDHHWFCIAGKKVPVSRENLKEFAEGDGSETEAARGRPAAHLLSLAPPAEKDWREGLDELLAPQGRHGPAFLQRAFVVKGHPAPQGSRASEIKPEAPAPQGAERDGALMPYKKFKPACLRHLVKVIGGNDRSYTDIHLDNELLRQCELGKQFPLTHRDGFENKRACEEFAAMLVDARDENLKEGTTDGYEKFCGQYYIHKGGDPVSVDPEWGVDPTNIHPSEKLEGEEGGEKGSPEGAGEEGGHGEEAALVCEDKHGEYSHHIAHNCHLWSIAILSFFMLELLVKIWVSPSVFFGNSLHVLDLIVVSVSLFIDTVMVEVVTFFWGNSEEGLDIVSLLLLITRLWRIVRIIHGIGEVMHAQKEEMDELEHEIAESKEANEKLQVKIQRLESGSRTG